MININLNNGHFSVTGNLEILLTEYTALTRLLVMELTNISNLETAFDITTTLGNIAVENLNQSFEDCNQSELCARISMMLDNKL